ncbi:MAG: hypothetical protein HKM98_02505 [Gammaproteobacteria bacterium]|nr:hypothetical protein [Gammaproteobacteria bacterium]
MKVSDAFPSKYIKADDLGNTRVTVTVMAVTMEDIGDKEFKPVMRFMAKDKGMVLNKTNAGLCMAAWGDEMDLWQGKQLDLFAQPVMFQGKQVMGLAVAPILATNTPQASQMAPAAQQMENLAADIKAAEEADAAAQDFSDDIPF